MRWAGAWGGEVELRRGSLEVSVAGRGRFPGAIILL